ncbi:uncharacterized protein [Zea mays]|jgi:hypothetical protein|uniref:DUF7722 domain-containing protein n=2 Tax=Zea mays TaxID=4577 RepID=B6SXC4_MAIZE|nr:uncharacterized protein LOC109940357 [Zea mays]ACG29507.1 hypothetical protein [Zea mays]|eukprot:XP_020395448.1 uncharacterized protein LOC109940357 [Zea mays]
MGSLGSSTISSMNMAKQAATTVGAKNGAVAVADQQKVEGPRTMNCSSYTFHMPLHYPRYKKADYESMPEWRVDCLLREYGLPVDGELDSKRKFAMGAFLWPDQY